MSSQNQNQVCAAFQERLPELFESEADLSQDEHLKTCENCAALVADLQAIVDAAKLMLPIHDPSPNLWGRISAEIPKQTQQP